MIARGPTIADDGDAWLGTAALVRATDPDAARDALTARHYADVEVHHWYFGGRSS